MKNNNRFTNELLRIVNGALRLDLDKVRNYTLFLAEKMQEAGDETTASRLRKILLETDHQLHPAKMSLSPMPVDSESRFPLLEKVNLHDSNEPELILHEDQWRIVNEFLSVAKSYSQIEEAGLATSLTLLLSGPPGTGKNRLAKYIARELGLDMFIARLDGIISSFLGSTSKNIRALFDFADSRPCILFLDEFDAIAKLRGDNQELGELKRVVNSFLQNLDSLSPHSILIAATNHEELLDQAVWRRFTYRLSLGYPSNKLRAKMWTQFLQPLIFPERDLEMIADLSEGFSGADIREVARRIRRRQVTEGAIPSINDIFIVLKNLSLGENGRKELSRLQALDDHELAANLRKRDSKLYSHAALGELLGVSKATAYRWTKGEE